MDAREPSSKTQRSDAEPKPRAAATEHAAHPESELEAARKYEEIIAASELSHEIFTGAFGTHVWGGRYEIDAPFQAGGQGTTFLGTDRKTGARVVAKVLDLKSLSEWKHLELFEREARALASLSHSLMPQFLEMLTDADTGARALVMTHIPGEDLARVRKNEGPLSEAALWQVLLDVTECLAALHRASSPLIHRDIKPQNLVRRPDGRVAVVDFGGVGPARRSEGSTVVGTFGYMAPEQLYGQSVPATDLYALGATLLTLATGKEPEEQPRQGLGLDVDRAAPHLSGTLREILKRLLVPEPERRYADAVELQQALQKLSHPEPRFAPPGDSVRSPWRKQDHIANWLDAFAAWLTLTFSFLGFVATVVLGNVLLPVLFVLVEAFAAQAALPRIRKIKKTINTGIYGVKSAFAHNIAEGAKQLRQTRRPSRRAHVAETGQRAQRRPRAKRRR